MCRGSPDAAFLGGSSVRFWDAGTAIDVYANTTGGMGWNVTVDGSQTHAFNASSSGFSQLLTSFSGLPSGTHNLTLITKAGATGASLTFDRAEVTIGTGFTGLVPRFAPRLRSLFHANQ